MRIHRGTIVSWAAGLLVGGLVLLCVAPAQAQSFAEGAGIRRFDFGPPGSPVLKGFTLATQNSAYDKAAGFGWVTKLKPAVETGWSTVKAPILTARVREFPDDAGRDHVYGFSGYDVVKPLKATFQVDLPNGEYLIRISVGDSGCARWTNPFHVDVNGARRATDLAPGADTAQTIKGKVTDGRLRITFTANAELSAKRCKQHRWTERIFTLWTLDYLMIYPAGKADAFEKDLETFGKVTVANLTARFVPKGRLQKFEVRDGCVLRDGKPMFFNHRHEWSYSRREFLDVLNHFAFGNAVMSHRGTNKARAGVAFLTPDWTSSGKFPAEMFAQATDAREAGMLCTAYAGVYSFLPAVVKNHPEYIGCVDNRGRPRDYPNYNDPYYRRYVRQVYASLGKWTRLHPGFIAGYPYEEMYYRVWDRTILSYDRRSLAKYRAFLKRRYGTIERLNAAWGSGHTSFEAIDPPKKREQSPNFANWQLHRARSLVEGYCRPSHEGFKSTDPNHLVIGEKPNGQYFYMNVSLCANGFNYTPYCDVAKGEGGLARNRAEIDYWRLPRANMNMALPQCAYKALADDALDPWTKRVPRCNDWVQRVGMFFAGMKALYTESYDAGGGAYHLIHPTKQYREKPPKTPVGRKVLKFRNVPLADIVIEPQALEVTRAHQFAYRTAPILMPARVRPSDVGHLCTEMTTLFGYSLHGGSNYGIQGDYRSIHRMLEQLHRPVDVLTEFDFSERLGRYRVVIAGLHATVAQKRMAAELKRFAAAGGAVILSGEALRFDYDTLQSGAESPVALLSEMLGADMAKAEDFISSSPLIVKNAAAGLKAGDVLLKGAKRWYTTAPVTGGKVIATVDGKPVVVGSPNGRALYLGVRLLGTAYQSQAPNEGGLRRLIGRYVDRGKSVPPVAVRGGRDAFQVRTGVLDGRGYRLVEISNTAPRDQKVTVAMTFLGLGRHDVVDITGERPIVVKNARHEFHLKRDLRGMQARSLGTITASNRLSFDMKARTGRVLMVRPAGQEVWQLLPDYTIRAVCKLPVSIVVPDKPTDAETTAAKRIASLLDAGGTDVRIVQARDIPVKSAGKAVTFRGYPLETFTGEYLDVDRNLIVIGEAGRNAATARLYAAGTFACDKVILRTSRKLPGAGRGVIQLVESINAIVYDVTDQSREAIVITGSDAAGVAKALARFQHVLWE